MTFNEMKARIRWAGEEAWHRGNLDAMDPVYHPDFVNHKPPLPDVVGLEAVKQEMADIRRTYSDLKVEYQEMIGEGNIIAYRWTWTARNRGRRPSVPAPPSGILVSVTGCTIAFITDDKVVEAFEHADYLGFLRQLGFVSQLRESRRQGNWPDSG